MNNFNQDDFNNFILDNNIIGFNETPRRLSSGKMSHWYVNWRNVANNAFLIDRVINFVFGFVYDHGLNPNTFYGVPDGATKLGILTAFEWARFYERDHTISMGRKEPKQHGDEADRYFVGAPAGKTIVIEDVTTTGESLMEKGLNYVKYHALKAELIAAIALTDRQEKVVQELASVRSDRGMIVSFPKSYTTVKEIVEQKYNIPFLAISHALELLPEAYQRQKPGKQIGFLVIEELAKDGISIRL